MLWNYCSFPCSYKSEWFGTKLFSTEPALRLQWWHIFLSNLLIFLKSKFLLVGPPVLRLGMAAAGSSFTWNLINPLIAGIGHKWRHLLPHLGFCQMPPCLDRNPPKSFPKACLFQICDVWRVVFQSDCYFGSQVKEQPKPLWGIKCVTTKVQWR